jgi:hypothetical protein
MHNQYEAYHRMYSALGVRDIDLILPPPPQPQPDGPAMENARAMLIPNGAPQLKAFPDQDHQSHMAAHIGFIKSNLIQTSPQVYGILLAHVFEHVTHMAMQQVQQHAQEAHQASSAMPHPQTGDVMNAPPPPPQMLQKAAAAIEAQLIQQVLQQLAPEKADDPLVQLQQRDLDIREQTVKQKAEEAALRIDLDERKLQQRQAEDNQKRSSNEDIQQLRANVSLQRARESKRV